MDDPSPINTFVIAKMSQEPTEADWTEPAQLTFGDDKALSNCIKSSVTANEMHIVTKISHHSYRS